jgi:peptidoglycan/LPS O-acetylase OafA/YrhL
MGEIKPENYRKDIDGLRAIAVLSVILFHMGYLPDGYLGVDVFFAISGYLITKIVYNEALENRFSIINFYLRRIRRIIPLVLFTTLIALITGMLVMLPDDLENLSQSVLATNLFANNILLQITTGNYWDIVNDYKPLMHTWSLGVEEQFYLLYPAIFVLFTGERKKWILPLLVLLTAISLFLYLSATNPSARFYLIQYRFYELALGGLGAIIFRNRVIDSRYKTGLLFIVLFILLAGVHLPPVIKLLLVVFASVGLLLPGSDHKNLSNAVLENKIMTGVGKISFSLYMWHQIVLAYNRYFVMESINVMSATLLFIIILILSVLSYYFIEQPFRDKARVNVRTLLSATGFLLILTSGSSILIFTKAGIIRDVPELGIYSADHSNNILSFSKRKSHVHDAYNARIYDLDKPFTDSRKIKVLVIGDSFARDWSNILLESKYGQNIEISYTFNINRCKDIKERLSRADIIFFSEMRIDTFRKAARRFDIDTAKVRIVGTKNFGSNNGIYYNKKGDNTYCVQKAAIGQKFLIKNKELKAEWGNKYIDLIGMVIDESGKVPVFTDSCMFISQDCRHLTRAGAMYFSRLLNNDLSFKPADRELDRLSARTRN